MIPEHVIIFILRLLEQNFTKSGFCNHDESYLFLPFMSRQRPQGLLGGIDDHQVFISVFRLPEAQPWLHPVSAVLRLVVSVGEGHTERDHDSLLASFSSSLSPLSGLLVFLMVKCPHVLSGLDLTNEIIDFWLLLWLLNTRATQIIGLILAFFLIRFGMSTNIPDATDFNALLIS